MTDSVSIKHRDGELLEKRLKEGHTVYDIAEELNTSDSVIRKWMKRNGVKRPINDKEYLSQMLERGMDCKEIGEEIDRDKYEVYVSLNQLGLINNGN